MEQVAHVTSMQVQALCANKSGKHWMNLLQALKDFDVDGLLISKHVGTADALNLFFQQDLEIDIPKVIVAGSAHTLHWLCWNFRHQS